MIYTLAVANYRSLRLLSETVMGRAASSLAREGGISSAVWAGDLRRSPNPLKAANTPYRVVPEKAPSVSNLALPHTTSATRLSSGYLHGDRRHLHTTQRSSARQSGTATNGGRDLAAALQTIIKIEDHEALAGLGCFPLRSTD